MQKITVLSLLLFLLFACTRDEPLAVEPFDNPELALPIPSDFPPLNPAFDENRPTKFGVQLGERLFHEKKFSGNNTISCASCHQQGKAFADDNAQAVGILGRKGLRNVPPIQNMAFMRFYNWDGHMLSLEKQAIVPIVTHEELNSSILEIIGKLQDDPAYPTLFSKAFGSPAITADRIYRSLAQYEYSLISANSRYDQVMANGGVTFTDMESRGYALFKLKCASCHSTVLFTDQTFRNVGFPRNPNAEEVGRARVTGLDEDWMRFRVPSLRNVAYTAPYGSFGQFKTLRDVLDYFDNGVLPADNLDPILQANGNSIPMTEQEKDDILAFLNTLSDPEFIKGKD